MCSPGPSKSTDRPARGPGGRRDPDIREGEAMRPPIRRPGGPRRGVTLVEMLVVVALVVLMMVILVQIFQSATGAMSLSRTTQELDIVLRQVDSMIRADLAGTTAC